MPQRRCCHVGSPLWSVSPNTAAPCSQVLALFSGSCSSGLLLKKRGKGACATGACPQGGMGSHRTHTFVGLQKYEFTKSIVGFIFSRCWVVKSLRFRCFQAPYKEMPWLFSSVRTQNQSALLSVGSYFVHINGPI